MTFLTTMTMPHTQRRKRAAELAHSLTEPLPQVTRRSVHAFHIVVTRSKRAHAINTQGHNVRLEIWLAGWHIALYDEVGERPVVSERDDAPPHKNSEGDPAKAAPDPPLISTPAGVDKPRLLAGRR